MLFLTNELARGIARPEYHTGASWAGNRWSTSILQNAVGESKRANDSVEQQLKVIKKLKFSEPYKFQRKVNEDQYKFNLKLTETTDNAK